MFWSTVLVAAILPLVRAADDDGLVWCGDSTENVPVCLTRVPDSCFSCLNPIETACGNAYKDEDAYATCLCTIPGKTWSGIEKCLNDASTGCSDAQKMIFNGYGVECGAGPKRDQFKAAVCNADNQKNDALLKALADDVCDGTITGSVVLKPTTTVAASTNTGNGPITSTATPTGSNTGSGSTGTTSHPTTTSGAVVTAGASALGIGGLNVAGVLIAAAIVNGF